MSSTVSRRSFLRVWSQVLYCLNSLVSVSWFLLAPWIWNYVGLFGYSTVKPEFVGETKGRCESVFYMADFMVRKRSPSHPLHGWVWIYVALALSCLCTPLIASYTGWPAIGLMIRFGKSSLIFSTVVMATLALGWIFYLKKNQVVTTNSHTRRQSLVSANKRCY